jgi:general secretion pathway protein A
VLVNSLTRPELRSKADARVRSVLLFRTTSTAAQKRIGIVYNSYFGFFESPFNVTPDPRFFYTNPTYLEVDASLRYGIRARKGFIVVTGEVGTGKTTLLRKLLRNFETTVRSVFIFNTHLSFPELLQVALLDLGLASKDLSKVRMLEELNGYLIKQLEQGHTVAMLIDEAQNLSVEALEDLRLLSNLETDQQKLLQIVLMGQPELDAKLDQPALHQLKHRVAIHSRLGPLKNEEVSSYIDFRLRMAGYEGRALFHHEAVQQIAFYSKGIPRLVNIICDNALLIAYAESRKIVPVDIIKQVARDLGIESQLQATDATPALPVSAAPRQTLIHKPPKEFHPPRTRRFVGAGVATALGLLFFAAAATVIDPRARDVGMTGKSLEARSHNTEMVPKEAGAEVELKPRGQRVIIRHGATIYKIASDVYGANTALGMDLIKEFNPQIEDLNWVFAGQDLMLPYLMRETLLRQQPDGSYNVIVASFRNRTGAAEQTRLLRKSGYPATITTRRVSDDLLLHRVEIDGLKDLEEADQIWQTGLRNHWFGFANNLGRTRHNTTTSASTLLQQPRLP